MLGGNNDGKQTEGKPEEGSPNKKNKKAETE